MSEHRKLVRYNDLPGRIFSVQYRVSSFPGPKLDDAGGADQTKQRCLPLSSHPDKIARLQDYADAINVFGISHGNGLDLHPIAIGASGGIASSQNRGNRRFTSRSQTKVEPMDPGIQQIPFVALNFDRT